MFALKKQERINSGSKLDFKQRKVIVIFSSFILLIVVFYFRTQSNLTEGLIRQGFIKTAENHYYTQLNEYKVELVYQPRTRHEGGEKERFELSINSRFKKLNIASLFCNEKEYQSFITGKEHSWFPTAEKKLANDYYVGQCYPSTIIDAIGKLPKKNHDFESRLMRYVFIPQLVNESQQRLEIYTVNTDINSLLSRMKNFVSYYDLVLKQ